MQTRTKTGSLAHSENRAENAGKGALAPGNAQASFLRPALLPPSCGCQQIPKARASRCNKKPDRLGSCSCYGRKERHTVDRPTYCIGTRIMSVALYTGDKTNPKTSDTTRKRSCRNEPHSGQVLLRGAGAAAHSERVSLIAGCSSCPRSPVWHPAPPGGPPRTSRRLAGTRSRSTRSRPAGSWRGSS